MPQRDESDMEGVTRAVNRAVVSEMRNDILDLRADIVRLESAVDATERLLGDLRSVTGRLEGEMRILVASYERAAALASGQALADLEIRRTGEIAAIEESKNDRKHRRELVIKLAAGVTGLWAIISALLARGC